MPPRKKKNKRTKKDKKAKKPSGEWYESPGDSSEPSATSSGDEDDSVLGQAPARSTLKLVPADARAAQEPSPFDRLLGSLLTSADSLPSRERSALLRVRREQEGFESDSVEEEAAEEEEELEPAVDVGDEVDVEDEVDKDAVDAAADDAEDQEEANAEQDPYVARYVRLSEPPHPRPGSVKLPNFVASSPDLVLSCHGPAEAAAACSAPPQFALKARLGAAWAKYASAMSRRYPQEKRDASTGLTGLQAQLAAHMMGAYRDVVFSARAVSNARELRELYVLHALNHALKARDLVERHSRAEREFAKTARQRREAQAALAASPGEAALVLALGQLAAAQGPDQDAARDQGFTRPRVLVVLPRRSACFAAVKLMQELMGCEAANMARFEAEFGPQAGAAAGVPSSRAANESDLHYGLAESLDPAAASAQDPRGPPPRPKDWHAEFDGNQDEEFKLGVALSGSSMHLYSDFYRSDVIFASPLGLRLATRVAIGAKPLAGQDRPLSELGLDQQEEEEQRGELAAGDEELDFLSSIEVLVMDQADALHMQNWQHVEDLACALNLRPRSLRPDMDFARIAERFLGAHAHEFRQNIVLQPFPDALTNALLARGGVQGAGLSRNFAGAVVFRALEFGPALVKQGVVQRFKRVDGGGGAEARLGCFESAVLPALLKQKHTLVFVPSFFDLVRLRKLFRQAAQGREDVFAVCSEYTPAKDVARARGEFFHGRVRVLLVSERFHYYFRYRLRGVARVVFYAPPSHPRFYAEILGLARGCTGGGGGQQEEALTLFQPADALELERCVGTSAARRLLSAQAKVRDWCFE